jgi:regulatory protein
VSADARDRLPAKSNAHAMAQRLLARREHSRLELRRKLLRKGFDEIETQAAIDRLVQQRLLSEERFVEALINARVSKGYGPVRIRKELEEKGIAPDSFGELLDPASVTWVREMRRVRQKRFGARLPASDAERAKQAKFLQYRGFTFDQIRDAFACDDVETSVA